MADDFCEFGMLPAASCEHCRGKPEPPPWVLEPLSPFEAHRWMAVRYGGADDPATRYRYLTDPEFHARVVLHEQQLGQQQIISYVWRKLHALAYPPEHSWAALAETADGDLGPWMLAQWNGPCRGCGDRIYEGDSIRYSALEGGMLCLECGSMREGDDG
jgi:hypothetical protein